MKKLLAILLLSPLIQSEIIEYYCEKEVYEYLTLKIDDDPNNKSFVIENSVSWKKVGNHNFIADVDNIKIMPITIFVLKENSDEYLAEMYEFNRLTNVLIYEVFMDSRIEKKLLEEYKSFIKSDSNIGEKGGDNSYYLCQPIKSNNP